MALQKTIATEYGEGINATYHNVRAYVWHKGQGVEVVLDSYLDAAARQAGKKPLGTVQSQIPLAEFGEDFDFNVLALADVYDALKAQDNWSGAVDV